MAPPPYNDLGKDAKDVFSKGYHIGLIKLDCKTKTETGVEFSTGGNSNQESGKVTGSLETKYKVNDYGVTFSEKWDTDNKLSTSIVVQDQILKGLKLGGDFNFSPHTGYTSGKFKSAFNNDHVALNADVDLANEGPVIDASAVVGHQGWLAGYQTSFDTGKSQLTANNFALGFQSGDIILNTTVNDGQEYTGSVYRKFSSRLNGAAQVGWTSADNQTLLGIGFKYDLDQDASVRAKVNNSLLVGLGYQQRLRKGVTLTLSALIDGQNLNSGGHRIGLALELEA